MLGVFMITIQKNLNDFIEQIESLADKIIACNDEDKLYVYLNRVIKKKEV